VYTIFDSTCIADKKEQTFDTTNWIFAETHTFTKHSF